MAKMGFGEPPLKLKYGNIPVTVIANGRKVTFKSKLEYRWAQYLDFLKEVGKIKDFLYEFHTFYFRDRTKPPYLWTPDFLVRTNENEIIYYETKGALSGFDIKKLKILSEERPYVKITYVFARTPRISVIKKGQLERYCERVIWDGAELYKQVPNLDMG